MIIAIFGAIVSLGAVALSSGGLDSTSGFYSGHNSTLFLTLAAHAIYLGLGILQLTLCVLSDAVCVYYLFYEKNAELYKNHGDVKKQDYNGKPIMRTHKNRSSTGSEAPLLRKSRSRSDRESKTMSVSSAGYASSEYSPDDPSSPSSPTKPLLNHRTFFRQHAITTSTSPILRSASFSTFGPPLTISGQTPVYPNDDSSSFAETARSDSTENHYAETFLFGPNVPICEDEVLDQSHANVKPNRRKRKRRTEPPGYMQRSRSLPGHAKRTELRPQSMSTRVPVPYAPRDDTGQIIHFANQYPSLGNEVKPVHPVKPLPSRSLSRSEDLLAFENEIINGKPDSLGDVNSEGVLKRRYVYSNEELFEYSVPVKRIPSSSVRMRREKLSDRRRRAVSAEIKAPHNSYLPPEKIVISPDNHENDEHSDVQMRERSDSYAGSRIKSTKFSLRRPISQNKHQSCLPVPVEPPQASPVLRKPPRKPPRTYSVTTDDLVRADSQDNIAEAENVFASIKSLNDRNDEEFERRISSSLIYRRRPSSSSIDKRHSFGASYPNPKLIADIHNALQARGGKVSSNEHNRRSFDNKKTIENGTAQRVKPEPLTRYTPVSTVFKPIKQTTEQIHFTTAHSIEYAKPTKDISILHKQNEIVPDSVTPETEYRSSQVLQREATVRVDINDKPKTGLTFQTTPPSERTTVVTTASEVKHLPSKVVTVNCNTDSIRKSAILTLPTAPVVVKSSVTTTMSKPEQTLTLSSDTIKKAASETKTELVSSPVVRLNSNKPSLSPKADSTNVETSPSEASSMSPGPRTPRSRKLYFSFSDKNKVNVFDASPVSEVKPELDSNEVFEIEDKIQVPHVANIAESPKVSLPIARPINGPAHLEVKNSRGLDKTVNVEKASPPKANIYRASDNNNNEKEQSQSNKANNNTKQPINVHVSPLSASERILQRKNLTSSIDFSGSPSSVGSTHPDHAEISGTRPKSFTHKQLYNALPPPPKRSKSTYGSDKPTLKLSSPPPGFYLQTQSAKTAEPAFTFVKSTKPPVADKPSGLRPSSVHVALSSALPVSSTVSSVHVTGITTIPSPTSPVSSTLASSKSPKPISSTTSMPSSASTAAKATPSPYSYAPLSSSPSVSLTFPSPPQVFTVYTAPNLATHSNAQNTNFATANASGSGVRPSQADGQGVTRMAQQQISRHVPEVMQADIEQLPPPPPELDDDKPLFSHVL